MSTLQQDTYTSSEEDDYVFEEQTQEEVVEKKDEPTKPNQVTNYLDKSILNIKHKYILTDL